MIEVSGLTKKYGDVLAVDDVSFSVSKGEIVGFLGPNGAGKSTTMKVLTGYLAPTEGTASINGHDIIDAPLAARSAVGYLPESTALYEEMGVVDYLRYMGRMQGVSAADIQGRIDDVIQTCGLGTMAHKDISQLSKGYHQRVGLAQALLNDPPVLILDEPTSGLDPAQIVEIRALIRRIAEEKAILLSTHILPEAQNTCSRILIISNGKLVGEGTSDELLDMVSGNEQYSIRLRGGDGTLKKLEDLRGVHNLVSSKEGSELTCTLTAEKGTDLREQIFDTAVASGAKLLELSHRSTSLEDVFLSLTGTTGRRGASADAEGGSDNE
ncbi:MAG: ATP-binding cassette domain-containing protein [Planctomycetales bacterium]|nr:ATP-binding cassette domain-containing protein [bacterium]UNM09324.1 MAG: ATP-binding cassette domain-containing protein [Planctomycetales bacterium]